MITNVKAQNFKGLTFDQALEQFNLFVGPNGSGKSARSEALFLARHGYLRSGLKKNQDIFAACGDPQWPNMTVEITHGNKTFARRLRLSGTGSVSQKLKTNGAWNVSKENFAEYLAPVPRVFDVNAFMDLSDQKKIDMIFQLFPPAGDVRMLASQIETLAEKLNAKVSDTRALEATVQKLNKAKSEIDLPTGTLAETQGELEKTLVTLSGVQKSLAQELLRESQAEEKANFEAKKAQIAKEAEENAKLLEKQKINLAERQKRMDAQGAIGVARQLELDKKISSREAAVKTAELSLVRRAGKSMAEIKEEFPVSLSAVVESIEKIMSTMTAAGCDACAAEMVCKMEMRKYK